jgi:flagellin
MVVQHNMAAMNTNRQLGLSTTALAGHTEKLSSGYKVNRASDDAAGLSISEKMRSQIRGLKKASENAQNGISLIQTAEGALNETHAILQRMNELATQAATDTNTADDRNAIKNEIDQLTSEVDRIYSTTQFNTMNLIDGNFSGKKLQVGSLSGQVIEVSIAKMNASGLGIAALAVSDNEKAGKSMSQVQKAIKTVSSERSKLGALQNRLSHTIKNLDTAAENTQAAESRIRDTNMAEEMVSYSATSITNKLVRLCLLRQTARHRDRKGGV